jgi:hypothetical protein
MDRSETIFYFHAKPGLFREMDNEWADRHRPPMPRFWDLVYEHSLKMLTPDETDIIRAITWLCSEGDVLWENCMRFDNVVDRHAPCTCCCVKLDAKGAAEVLAKLTRAKVGRKTILYFASHADIARKNTPGWEEFAWRTYEEFVALLRKATNDKERWFVAMVFDEPPAAAS